MSEWNRVQLGDLCDAERGITYGIVKVGDYIPGGVPVIRGGDIRDNKIVFDDKKRVSPEISNQFRRTILQGGEIVLNLIAEPGHSAVVPLAMAGFNVSRDVAVIPVSSRANHLFVNYFLKSPDAVSWLEARLNGSVTQKINLGVLREVPVPLPSPSCQDAIAEILGALDDKIAVNDQIVRISLDLADSFYEMFSEGLYFGPEAFGTVANVYGGGTPSTAESSYWEGGIAWTTPSDVTALSAPYLFKTDRTITESGLANCASQLYPAGSIFMTSRATIGAFAVPQIPAAVNQGFIVVVSPRDEMRWWLFHEMRSRIDDMLSLANGSTFLELSRKNFKAMPARVGPSDVIRRFDAKVAPLHQQAAKATQESATLVELRNTLLPKLMSGEIRVQDAEKVVEDVT
jgi:type I restriction enzyme S subunit